MHLPQHGQATVKILLIENKPNHQHSHQSLHKHHIHLDQLAYSHLGLVSAFPRSWFGWVWLIWLYPLFFCISIAANQTLWIQQAQGKEKKLILCDWTGPLEQHWQTFLASKSFLLHGDQASRKRLQSDQKEMMRLQAARPQLYSSSLERRHCIRINP